MPNLARSSPVAAEMLDKLSPDEKAYFIACTDIFHDKQYNVIGRPSCSSQLQNCVTLNLTRSFASEDFGLVGQTWDVNFVSLPFITTQLVANCADWGFELEPPGVGANAFNIGGITAFAAPSGTPVLPPVNPSSVVSLNANTAIFPSYTGSASNPVARVYYQILSMGFEAINATPELYRSGNVIRYRVPTQNRSLPIGVNNPYLTPLWPSSPRESLHVIPLPPTTSSFATQYPDSVIDEAISGTYSMHTLQDQVSDFYVTGNERILITSPVIPTPGQYNSYCSSSLFTTAADYDPPFVRGDFDMVGAYFTGLAPQSVITIRYRIILSTVPSSSDTYLSSLAKMSPPSNPELDRLISLVQNEFLPGIPAGMNPKGEWWKVVLKGVTKAAPKVAGLLGGSKAERVLSQAIGLADSATSKKGRQRLANQAVNAAMNQAMTRVPRYINSGPSRQMNQSWRVPKNSKQRKQLSNPSAQALPASS